MITDTIQKLRVQKLFLAETQAKIRKLGQELIAEAQREVDGQITITTSFQGPAPVKAGPKPKKEKRPRTKITDEMRGLVMTLRKDGSTLKQIKKVGGISLSAVNRIIAAKGK